MNEQKIWNKLINAGLTAAGAAGLMGNLYAESGLNPINMENQYERKLGFTDETYTRAVDAGTYANFANDCAGYGLAQWTYCTRKANLLAFARKRGCSIGDLDMQVDFLLQELRTDYPAVWRTLTTVDNVRSASDVRFVVICIHPELVIITSVVLIGEQEQRTQVLFCFLAEPDGRLVPDVGRGDDAGFLTP